MEKFPLLDVVIGLSLIYTFLSLFASELTVLMVKTLRLRDRQLRRTIFILLGELPPENDGLNSTRESIANSILNHPQITSVIHSFNAKKQWLNLCCITPQLFAEVLLDTLQSLPQSNQAVIIDRYTNPGLLANNSSCNKIDQLFSIINSAPEISPLLRANLTRMIHRVKQMETDPEQQLLQLKNEIGLWFSYALKSPSSTYKLHFKFVSFLVSLVVVVIANVDSLYVIRRLSENTATRAIVMENASHIQACQKELNSPRCTERLSALMERTTVPVSWHPSNSRKQFTQLSRVVILRTIGGWALSSLAIAMGSRFWLQVFHRLGTLMFGGEEPRRS